MIRVLLVDDEQTILNLAKTFLEEMNEDFQVGIAPSGEEALQRLSKEAYDVVVSDYRMPAMNGIEFLGELRGQGNEIPFIIFTGKGREEVAVEAFKRGADGYIMKGGDPTAQYVELAHSIRNAVTRKRTEEALRETERRLLAVIEGLGAGLEIVDKDGVFTYVNPAYARMLGYTPEEIIGKPKRTFMRADSLAIGDAGTAERRQESSSHDVGLVSKDGRIVPALMIDTPFLDERGQYAGSYCLAVDLTEQKKTEEALKRWQENCVEDRLWVETAGTIPWGSHLCQFYEAEDDLLETLVPYFAEGLRKNEFCMWVTSPPLGAEEAKAALKKAVPDLEQYVEKGQIEFSPYTEWYLLDGEFNLDRVLEGWMEKERAALNRGLAGLRLTGDTCWVERDLWEQFAEYESVMQDVIGKHQMIVLCTYQLEKCTGGDIVDVIRNHQNILIKKRGAWVLAEDVISRRRLEKESEESRKRLIDSEERFRSLVELAHNGIMLTEGPERSISYANRRTAEMLGYASEELIGKNYLDLCHPDERKEALRNIKDDLTSGKPSMWERRLIKKDGSILHSLISSSLLDQKDEARSSSAVLVLTDVTEQKRLEDEIESLARFPSENPNPILRLSQNGIVLEANPASKALFRSWGREIGDRAPKSWQDLAAEALENGLNRTVDIEHEERVYTFHVVPNIDAGYVNLYGRDIADRKKLEVQLRESEAKYRSFVEMASDGILMTSGHRRTISFANRRMAEMLGYTVQELIGRDYFDLVHPEEKEEVLSRRRIRAASARPSTYQRRLVKKDGSTLSTLVSASLLDPENPDESSDLVIFADMTEYKKLEDAIRESEQRLNAILDAAGDGILVSQDGKYVYANPAACQMYKYARETLIGLPIERMHTPERREEVIRDHFAAMQGEGPQGKIVEDTHIAGDGTELLVRETRSSILWQGAPAQVVIHHDITEENRAEERERFLHSLLRHDIANKLQGAYGYLELLKRTGLSQKQEAYAQRLRGSLEDTIELIDNIRQLMAVDERREIAVMNLDTAIRDSIESFSIRAEEQGIAIEYQGISGSMVTASPLLANAFTNLIGNSISHADCRRIRISTSQLEDGYRITVEDDGKGVPDAVKRGLFRREVRGPESTGSGLGLLLVKRILEASGGTIELKDTEKGTRFDVYLRKATRREGSTDLPCS